MTSQLFTPITLGPVTFANRVFIAPMCQYSVLARDGVPTDWHLVHLGSLASGGASLVITEATAVSPEGRISPQDTGIWNDEQQEAWARIVGFVHERGAKAGIQLQHAGRKASTYAPWGTDRRGTVAAADGGWTPLGPSAVAFPGYDTPEALDAAGIDTVVADFATAARRALDAGFDVLELHAAHGYLLHQFLSPLSNRRDDQYGGSLENRARLLMRVLDAVTDAAAGRAAVFVRFSATDWLEGGWTESDTATVARWARDAGADFFDISTGGNAHADIPVGPGYQVRFAQYVRSLGEVPVGAVGIITDGAQAEQIVASGQADAVLIAREALRDPHTPQRWARELGADEPALWQPQYERARVRR
ncbi:NADH:flavin oxidoreductase/NADH oxidase [Gryllotalpicola protaetiae]|uniref:NADH:flavin oxidoreductase/NADH oxidase n=1 Tax=Gryllotalpicola protaetiae TaxID=2419771 RepID=A0A387BPB2_9MICO|nr:NADH:flavin oxidoreductase/NADH oxidase [Gryllotalpicola protaetiae]AYG04322.1 NADH:flavin oxidoreductase/NADH oxidase [Gryllotalpicola protaetiae]